MLTGDSGTIDGVALGEDVLGEDVLEADVDVGIDVEASVDDEIGTRRQAEVTVSG